MLYLVRGLPGAGKSTFAKTLSLQHFESDQFFINSSGKYLFKKEKLFLAHQNCISRCKKYLQNNRQSGAVVSNTFTTYKEIKPYLQLAADLEISVTIITLTTSYGSIHNVPVETIDKMRKRFSPNCELKAIIAGVFKNLQVEYVYVF